MKINDLLELYASSKNIEPASQQRIEDAVSLYASSWSKEGSLIVSGLEKIMGTTFLESSITGWVTDRICGAISSPLLLTAHIRNENAAVDIVTHELIHRLAVMNNNGWNFTSALDLFLEEQNAMVADPIAKTHVFVHAVHKELFETILKDTERLNTEIQHAAQFPSYKYAWDLVQGIGSVNIVRHVRPK